MSEGTEPSTSEASGTKKSVIPMPARMKAGTMSTYGVLGVSNKANHAKPAVCRIRPGTTNRLPPQRSARTPTRGARTMIMPVHGRIRSPALSGE